MHDVPLDALFSCVDYIPTYLRGALYDTVVDTRDACRDASDIEELGIHLSENP
jgi:hypothetical protein